MGFKLFLLVVQVVLNFQYMLVECNNCITTQDSSENQKGQPCAFPFVIGGKTFNECTTEKDPDGKLWCATETDDSDKQIPGKWGYCPDDCQPTTCKTTNESGSKKKNAPCQFPFTLNDKTFDACTDLLDPDGRFWCSTKVDSSGKHTQGNWGYCSEDCFPSTTTTTTTTTTEKPTCLTTNESGSPVKNAPCLFPWNFGDQTFDSCTTVEDPDGRHWCATKLDQSGTFIDEQWGYCPEECIKKEEPTHSNTSGLWLPTEYEGCGNSAGRNVLK